MILVCFVYWVTNDVIYNALKFVCLLFNINCIAELLHLDIEYVSSKNKKDDTDMSKQLTNYMIKVTKLFQHFTIVLCMLYSCEVNLNVVTMFCGYM